MNIKVKQNPDKGQKVHVNIIKDLSKMSIKEIIKELDLFKVLLDHHYNVCDEYKRVDDIYSESTNEYLGEVLYEAYRNDDFDYDELAGKIIKELEDKLVEEIYYLDENARAE